MTGAKLAPAAAMDWGGTLFVAASAGAAAILIATTARFTGSRSRLGQPGAQNWPPARVTTWLHRVARALRIFRRRPPPAVSQPAGAPASRALDAGDASARAAPRGWPGVVRGRYADAGTLADPDTESCGHPPGRPLPGLSLPDPFPGMAAPPTGSLRAWLWGEQGVAGEYLLASRSVRVGRDPASDIVLDVKTVSREHARLKYDDGGWWLLPEITSNGTWVNGRLIRPGELVPVCDNDRLRFGPHTQLRLRVPPGHLD